MTKEWDPKHKPLLTQALKDLADYDVKHPSTSELSLVRINDYYLTLYNAT